MYTHMNPAQAGTPVSSPRSSIWDDFEAQLMAEAGHPQSMHGVAPEMPEMVDNKISVYIYIYI